MSTTTISAAQCRLSRQAGRWTSSLNVFTTADIGAIELGKAPRLRVKRQGCFADANELRAPNVNHSAIFLRPASLLKCVRGAAVQSQPTRRPEGCPATATPFAWPKSARTSDGNTRGPRDWRLADSSLP